MISDKPAPKKKKKRAPPALPIVVKKLIEIEAPIFVREYRFSAGRDWAFDIAWPALKVAVEYEGNTWVTGNSRHTTGIGYRGDVDKYNEAAILGWCVIRVTRDMVDDFSFVEVVLTAVWSRMPS